ncbi:hypothetical protein DICVIV_00405 [Dictyocaulus viviparus]|uniref:Uncharacterized protein n=1 Tax=Dictyocaulus viviparus TaxID=29172 RepID=A0A0D8YB85_DICVI|nr:hypothetical protein DICVIV_00405 [Dictyocaulus viviparus]
MLRDRNRIAVQSIQNTNKSLRRRWMWLLFIIPSSLIILYIAFVVYERRLYRMQSQYPPPQSKGSPSIEAANKNDEKALKVHSELKSSNDIEAHEARPLVLTNELKGDVRFADEESSAEIHKVEFDEKLNEVVGIGPDVEIVPMESSSSGIHGKLSTAARETPNRTKSKVSVWFFLMYILSCEWNLGKNLNRFELMNRFASEQKPSKEIIEFMK